MNILTLSFVLMSLVKLESTFAKYDDYKIVSITNKCSDDTNVIKKKLPIYHVMDCFGNLLRQIVKANHRYYDPKIYFYSLSFKKEGDRRYLVIESSKYKSSKVFDYIGAVKMSGATFLCRGDITIDTIFRKHTNTFLNVYLKRTKEADDFDYSVEPSLRGLYQECNEIKINLEIYTRATLPGYRMEERKSKKPSS
jgi:hypothetical protein